MKIGNQTGWQCKSGIAPGQGLDIYARRTQIECEERVIAHNGRSDDPAVLTKSDNGSLAVKRQYEAKATKGGGDV